VAIALRIADDARAADREIAALVGMAVAAVGLDKTASQVPGRGRQGMARAASFAEEARDGLRVTKTCHVICRENVAPIFRILGLDP
jgi:hypothetical protein